MPKSKLSNSAPGPSAEPQAAPASLAEQDTSPNFSANHTAHSEGRHPGNGTAVLPGAGPHVTGQVSEKIKELVRLAQEQGYLTFTDINDALPDGHVTADQLDDIYIQLRSL